MQLVTEFLNQSYNIKSESEERASKVGFAFASTPELDETMKTLRSSQENLIDDSRRKLELTQLDLERKRQSELFGLEDLIRNLEMEREQYSQENIMAYRDPTFNANMLTDLLDTYLTNQSKERERYFQVAQ